MLIFITVTWLILLTAVSTWGMANMSAATDRLTASITNLNTAVDAAVAKLSATPDDSAVNAAADAVDAAVAKLNGATGETTSTGL